MDEVVYVLTDVKTIVDEGAISIWRPSIGTPPLSSEM
jgi:hypothetical protein